MARKKVRLEFLVKASPGLLYPMLSSPSGLSSWFCDDVNIRNDEFTFIWNNDTQTAKLLKKVFNKSVKFHWNDTPSDEFFEFEIEKDEITDDIAVVVTDFVEEAEEKEFTQLWESQVNDLRHALGS